MDIDVYTFCFCEKERNMSADISVILNKKINISALLIGTKAELKKILCSTEDIDLSIWRLNKGKREEILLEEIKDAENCYLLGPRGYYDAVGLVFIGALETNELEMGISVGSIKTPIEYAIAAAIAIYIAKEQNTNVIDDGCVWSSEYEQTPDEFENQLILKENYESIQIAAEVFYRNMYMNSGKRI